MQQFPRYKVPRRVPPLQPHYLIEISLGSPRYYQREERERGGGEREKVREKERERERKRERGRERYRR
jgi:hypothetical protein